MLQNTKTSQNLPLTTPQEVIGWGGKIRPLNRVGFKILDCKAISLPHPTKEEYISFNI